MPSQGPFGGIFDEDLGGTEPWLNTGNVFADDGLTADNSANAVIVSNSLRVTDFGFSVPLAATIQGVVVEIKGSGAFDSGANLPAITQVYLAHGGAPLGGNRSDGAAYSAVDYHPYGGVSDLWDANLTPSIVNSVTFGTQFAFQLNGFAGGQSYVFIDYVRITVHYAVITEGYAIPPEDVSASRVLIAADEIGTSPKGLLHWIKVAGGGDGLLAQLAHSEDAAHVSGDFGVLAQSVRKDQPVALTGVDGRRIPHIQDANSRTWVNLDRNPLGVYRVGGPLITGGTAAQNIMSIENPLGSGRVVYVKKIAVQTAMVARADVHGQWHVGRASTPTGTALTAQKIRSSDPAPVAVVRTAPTSTPNGGDLATLHYGTTEAAAGQDNAQFFPRNIIQGKDASDVIELQPTETLLIRVDANDADMRHVADILWAEV